MRKLSELHISKKRKPQSAESKEKYRLKREQKSKERQEAIDRENKRYIDFVDSLNNEQRAFLNDLCRMKKPELLWKELRDWNRVYSDGLDEDYYLGREW